MRIVSGASTDKGQVRDGNEDSYLVDRRLRLFAIADGMGGHRAGEVASATALEGLQVAVDEGVPVADAVGRANTAVWDKASGDTSLAGMGTTLTAAWFDGTVLTLAHVGDSRAYLWRDGTLSRITVDHSLVEELIRDGKLTEEQAAVHPQRSIITRALGIDSTVEVDVYSLPLQDADRVMLCSDGLTSMVRSSGIAELLEQEADPTAAANALVDAANAAGGDDNITVVVLDAQSDGVDPLPSSVAASITAATTTATTVVHPTSTDDGESPQVVDPAPVTMTTTTTSMDAAAANEPSASEAAPDLPRDTAKYRDPKRRRGRGVGRGVWRFLLFAVPILLIVGIGIGTIGWYAKNSYFVAFDRGVVVIERGRPGGLLFWDPEVIQRTSLTRDELTPLFELGVKNKKEFSTREGAVNFVRRARTNAKTTPTTTTTTAPVAGSTATTAPATSPVS